MDKFYMRINRSLKAFIALLFSISWLGPVYAAGPLVDISDKPLYATQINAKPTLTLALSVENPTSGLQYQTVTYDQNTEYIGYFNANLCYDYYIHPTSMNDRYFTPSAQPSVNHGCAGRAFSGNFLNWATSSAIDVLRYSLTGGDRVIDTSTKTVLQRAAMHPEYFRQPNSAGKMITAAQARQAVPGSLRFTPGSTVMHNGPIYINNCVDKTFFFTQATSGSGVHCRYYSTNRVATSLGSRLTGDPYFFARAEVCTRNADGSLQDVRRDRANGEQLCVQFPSGIYKPVGKFYWYADKLRVAAFGYPFIERDSAYKGVLRAPMKYLGLNTYDSDYNFAGPNPRREWDPLTGVFYPDPEGVGAPFNISGVINYLNQFGRTDRTQLGIYVTNDHVNQLYYEALRYLQGLQPTPEAVASDVVNVGTYNGFPIYRTWQDPHPPVSSIGATGDYSCFRNYVLTIGDKHTNLDNQVPGYNRQPAGNDANEPNFWDWTNIAGGFEANSNRSYRDGEGVLRYTTGNPTPVPSKANMADQRIGVNNKANFSLVGMAYWANTHDIRGSQWTRHVNTSGSGDPRRPGMRVTSYFIDVNEGNASINVNTRLSVDQYHYAGKYGGFDARRSLGGNPFTSDGRNFSNALWQRGIGTNIENERFGYGFFLASDASAVLSAFDNIFDSIVDKSYSIAGIASSSGYSNTLSRGDIVFQGSFNGANWSGDVFASTVAVETVNGQKRVSYPAVVGWSPADALDNRNIILRPRNILIGQRSAAGTYAATNFRWANLTAAQQTALTSGGGNGSQIVDFLRGDRSREGRTMRVRGSLLGDISNSGVAYKGAPGGISYDADYRTFYESNKGCTPVVYVGANDGMLHAFNADVSANTQDKASEIFAYIPSFVADNLFRLSEVTYDHQAYVDATPAVAEAKINGSWRTVLVGGAGAGGQGVYALDVTNPNSLNASNLLWEFTDRDDASMGNVLSAPQIVQIASKATADSPVEYRWYALVAGGVNNEVDDGYAASSGSGPALFILDLSKPSGDRWERGVNYYKVVLPPDQLKDQGLINFTAVVNRRQHLQTVYAGDLSGQLWKIEFGELLRDRSQPVPVPFLLFRAGFSKQITSAPAVTMYGDMTILSFGTGMYLGDGDTKPPYNVQSIFTILDANEFVNLGVITEATPQAGNRFQVNAPFTWGAPSVATPSGPSVRSGWFVNLPASSTRGERVVYNSSIRDGIVVTNSILPPVGGCDLGGGRQYTMNLLQGSGSFKEFEQMLGSITFVNVGANISIDPDTGNVIIETESQTVSPGAQGGIVSPGDNIISNSKEKGVLDWREIQSFGVLNSELSGN